MLGLGLLGEQRVWERARKDIMAIADRAADSFRPGGAGGDSIDLKVVKAFADLVGIFLPPQLKPVLEVGKAALNIVDVLKPEDTPGDSSVELSGYTPDEVYNSLVDIVGKLEQRVFDQEWELAYSTLSGLLEYMQGHDASQFHIHPDKGIDPELLHAPQLTIHPEVLRKIGYQISPRIAAYLGRAAESAQAADKPSIWSRTNYIGLSPDGPYPKWSEVLGEFDAVTTGSGKELVEAGRLLAVGAGFTEDTDGDVHTELKGVEDDLGRGSTEWDNEPPASPTRSASAWCTRREQRVADGRLSPCEDAAHGGRAGWGAQVRCAAYASWSSPAWGLLRTPARSSPTSALTSSASTARAASPSPRARTTS